MTEEPKNYRYSRRVDVNYHAVFKTPSDTIECTVTQISEGGVLLVSHKPVDINTKGVFALSVFSNEADVVIEGEIIYRLPQREGRDTLVYGARFVAPDARQKEDIARVLRYSAVRERYTHKPSSRKAD
jgi:hypothetical protein